MESPYLKSYWFKLLISLDQLLNALLGGDEDVCLSTRAYIQSQPSMPNCKRWIPVRKAIDAMFFKQREHCRGSYVWELHKSRTWAKDNKQHKLTISK